VWKVIFLKLVPKKGVEEDSWKKLIYLGSRYSLDPEETYKRFLRKFRRCYEVG
jgi:hypothetical protein